MVGFSSFLISFNMETQEMQVEPGVNVKTSVHFLGDQAFAGSAWRRELWLILEQSLESLRKRDSGRGAGKTPPLNRLFKVNSMKATIMKLVTLESTSLPACAFYALVVLMGAPCQSSTHVLRPSSTEAPMVAK